MSSQPVFPGGHQGEMLIKADKETQNTTKEDTSL